MFFSLSDRYVGNLGEMDFKPQEHYDSLVLGELAWVLGFCHSAHSLHDPAVFITHSPKNDSQGGT